jgi:NAD(P)-dependent dehydrogenase (short-subunit alcohol dehydrogenase family)
MLPATAAARADAGESMDVRRLTGKIALVTGAGSGIGRASAQALAARGADLVLCDLDDAGLEATAAPIRAQGRRVHTRRVDVADRAAMEEFAAGVHADVGPIDVLMNNAGVGLAATFADSTLDDWQWLLGVNLLGVVHGCHFFVPRMIAGGRGGHVVNVASMAAFAPSEHLCAYATSKFAVLGFSEALRAELRPHGIGVTALCPGIVKTAIVERSPGRGLGDSPEVRARIVAAYERRDYGPERVAADMLRAVQRNRGVAPSSPEAWLAYYLKRLAPALMTWLSRVGQRRMFTPAP